jgi:hypothetical protein
MLGGILGGKIPVPQGINPDGQAALQAQAAQYLQLKSAGDQDGAAMVLGDLAAKIGEDNLAPLITGVIRGGAPALAHSNPGATSGELDPRDLPNFEAASDPRALTNPPDPIQTAPTQPHEVTPELRAALELLGSQVIDSKADKFAIPEGAEAAVNLIRNQEGFPRAGGDVTDIQRRLDLARGTGPASTIPHGGLQSLIQPFRDVGRGLSNAFEITSNVFSDAVASDADVEGGPFTIDESGVARVKTADEMMDETVKKLKDGGVDASKDELDILYDDFANKAREIFKVDEKLDTPTLLLTLLSAVASAFGGSGQGAAPILFNEIQKRGRQESALKERLADIEGARLSAKQQRKIQQESSGMQTLQLQIGLLQSIIEKSLDPKKVKMAEDLLFDIVADPQRAARELASVPVE